MRYLLALLLLARAGAGQNLGHPLDSRLLNLPTLAAVGPSTLEVTFTHRFTQPAGEAGGEGLFGLDSPSDVGIGLVFGLSPRAQVELYRSSFWKELELAGKVVVLPPGPGRLWGLALRAGGNYRGAFRLEPRWSGFVQAIVGLRPNGRWELALVPTFVTDTPTLQRAGNVGLQWVLHLPRRFRVEAEVIPPNSRDTALAWAIGVTKGVGGHSFTVYLGNSRATTTDLWVGSDFPGGFRGRDLRLGFNLVRRFPE
ncbi:MAG: DUF5777 family beta-barrel protein [Thermoanaerobaculum sp.]